MPEASGGTSAKGNVDPVLASEHAS